MKTLVIDRFENNYALCEDEERRMFAIERQELPAEAKEGDVLRISDEGEIKVDAQETAQRRDKNRKKQDKLFR